MRLAGEIVWEPCPTCQGKGKVPCPPTLAVRTGINGSNDKGPINQVSDGYPIPCPECKGKKVVAR